MGRLLAGLFRKEKHRVIICGRDEDKAKRVAQRLHVHAGPIADVANANIVIVSVPIENTVDTCSDVLQRMMGGSLLVEISSVKTGVIDRIADLVPPQIEYLSLHPLFGPSVREFEGQNMIAIPVRQAGLSNRMIASLRHMGLAVEISSAEEHDKIMATLQVIHHYAYLVMAVELAKIAGTTSNFTRYLTHSLKRTLAYIRSLNAIRETVFSIQKLNPYGLQARREFALSAHRMIRMDNEVTSEVEQAIRVLEHSVRPRRRTKAMKDPGISEGP